jgi:sarcosine oxidase subunit alpha
MPDTVRVFLNGKPLNVPPGTIVAAAVLAAGQTSFRRSLTGEPRAPICGMGICFECRVTVDGEPHARSCQLVCRQGMDIRTDA